MCMYIYIYTLLPTNIEHTRGCLLKENCLPGPPSQVACEWMGGYIVCMPVNLTSMALAPCGRKHNTSWESSTIQLSCASFVGSCAPNSRHLAQDSCASVGCVRIILPPTNIGSPFSRERDHFFSCATFGMWRPLLRRPDPRQRSST